MRRLLYTLVITALLPWALLHLWLRSRKQPEYLAHISERFGHYPASANTAPLIWIHAVSVGETRAAEPLITALRQQYPQHRILLSHMTPTGRATRSAILDSCERCYLPYDTPWGAHAFLAHYRPAIGLIMETELWPNLIAACHARKTPLLLLNARLSARSAKRYEFLAGLTHEALRQLSAIAAQSQHDADRLAELGAKNVHVCGNLKFDVTLPETQMELARQWRAALNDRPIVLCGSTREGEEELLLDAWQRAAPKALLLIVPRHPQRFNEVATLIESRQLNMQRRSQGLPDRATAVWLGDSMGEMAAYYAVADLAFIGGSLLDFGSQNLIEACAAGTPVLLGPSTYNFAEAARNALDCGAALAIKDADDFVNRAAQLVHDKDRLADMQGAGLKFAAAHRGATQRTLALIETTLAAQTAQ